MKTKNTNLVAPDGGWAWMVCLGTSLINISLRSLDPSFGLLFGDLLTQLKVDTTGASVITSCLEAVMCVSGLFMGPLIKKFGYRKVAFFGSLLNSVGLILTSQANSVPYIILTYSILGGFGTGIGLAASFVGINCYFKEKRSQAVGFYMAGTSLGMMCMPQIVHLLLIRYDFRGTVLILGAITLHSLVGSCLLQPVKYHLKPAPCEKEQELASNGQVAENRALLKTDGDSEEIKLRKVSMSSSISEMSNVDLTKNCRKDEKTNEPLHDLVENDNESDNDQESKKSFLRRLATLYDLSLFKDFTYINIVVGLSLFYVTEMNFKTITPFLLKSIGMTKGEVAFSLSLTAFADVVARLTLPTICAKLKFTNRNSLWVGIVCLGVTRSVLAHMTPGKLLMGLLLVNGMFRGLAMTNFNLCVAEHCTLGVLPSALGIANIIRGVIVVTLGPLLGYIKDTSGSFRVSIHTMTSFIALCSVMWGTEYLLRKYRMRRSRPEKESKEIVA